MNKVTREDVKLLIEEGEEITIDVLSKTVCNVITHNGDKDGARFVQRIVKEKWTMDDDQLLLLIVEYGKFATFVKDTVVINKPRPPKPLIGRTYLSSGDIVRLKNGLVTEIADIHNEYIITTIHQWYSFDEIDKIIKKWNEV